MKNVFLLGMVLVSLWVTSAGAFIRCETPYDGTLILINESETYQNAVDIWMGNAWANYPTPALHIVVFPWAVVFAEEFLFDGAEITNTTRYSPFGGVNIRGDYFDATVFYGTIVIYDSEHQKYVFIWDDPSLNHWEVTKAPWMLIYENEWAFTDETKWMEYTE